MLIVRAAKIAVVAGFALHASLVVFGNVTDYGTNLEFVRHVLSMHTIFPNSTIAYRAITDPTLQNAAYLIIIATESAVAALCWLGAYRLIRYIRDDGAAFNRTKGVSVAGLTLGILLWRSASQRSPANGSEFGCRTSGTGIPDGLHIVMILYASLIFLVMRDDDLRASGRK